MSANNDDSEPCVQTAQGIVQGRKAETLTGNTFYCFQGIPFAKPPVGLLRFKDPQPPEKWEGIKQTKAEGEMCAQVEVFVTRMYEGEEDCLSLNVYTPKLATKYNKTLLPVLVYIHGGAFCSGSGNTALYGPEYFMDEDVIIVTINYRLGVLGFLCLDTPEVPGNAGLKDQIMSLKWIQANIKQFGGDPNNVTIFGESAGGSSVHFLVLSPAAKGLFHKAVAQSGCATNVWANIKNPVCQAFKLGKELGFEGDSKDELLHFLTNHPIEQLVKASHRILDDGDKRKCIAYPFCPVTEKQFPGIMQILTVPAVEALKLGNFNHVPFIVGRCSNEGILMLQSYHKEPDRISRIENNFQYFVPDDLNYEWNSDKSIDVSRKIKQFYFKDKNPSSDTIDQYVQLMSDFVFSKDIDMTAKISSEISSAPVYYYMFSYEGQFNLLKSVSRSYSVSGAAHGDEIGYLFKTLIFRKTMDPNSPDGVLSQQMVRMWSNFAKYGVPVPKKDDILTEDWDPLTSTRMNYLEIGKTLRQLTDPDNKRLEFWRHLYDTASIGKRYLKNVIDFFENKNNDVKARA